MIAHAQHGELAARVSLDVDHRLRRSWRGVFAGVINEIEENLLHRRRVDVQRRFAIHLRGMHAHLHAAVVGALLQARQDAVQQFADGHVFGTRLATAAFESRIGQHVFNEMAKATRFTRQRVEIGLPLRFIGHHAIREHFRVKAERCQRCAQFVRHGGDEIGPPFTQRHGAV